MTDGVTSVALLFDDASLSAHLREALVAQGARIVYESDLAAFAPAELVGSSADVVVVDLDDPSDTDLDRLYDTVEGGHPRLVFNDADASRSLQGWDRARWARHLAAKLVGGDVIDPPRPDHARAIEPRIEAIASVAAPAEEHFVVPLDGDLAITGSHGYPDEPVPVADDGGVPLAMDDDVDDAFVFSAPQPLADEDGEGADPVELAAELEALLADSDTVPTGDVTLEDVPSSPVELNELASLGLSSFELVDDDEHATAATTEIVPAQTRSFDLSSLSLASFDDAPAVSSGETSSVHIEARATEYVPPPVPEWDLLDHDAVVAAPADARAAPADFGIETLSAAEFLAQDVVDDGSAGIEPGLGLELVSLEEAVAPTMHANTGAAHEMFLEGSARAVRRVVALAGTHDSEAAIARFLATLPAELPALLLVVAHHDGDSDAFAARLSSRAQVARAGEHAASGDVRVVAHGTHVQVRRDGSLTVRDDMAGGPSIDGVLSTLAGGFGADALAIVFAGRGNDAVAGAQAIYDAGGRVWVETVAAADDAGHMVAGVREERVAGYAGDVDGLARKLIEEHA
ncbi:chemotaxis protein CheB [Luteibacter sp. PPL201]|uniref:protein-glutamate methylesterase n=1 Tax=Luteibacter sahnii TaxID=3021977 RepID=A0ABT6BAW0_9GAMM|nr:chemotaxis protein CheB [Luteibacter sp. PPL193]MDY1547178.1 chemotaxis protein CheB [Luteibacter sp. PPL193]